MPKINLKRIVNFFFELGMLKRGKHQGVCLAGVTHPDSLADHSARASLIAYILAFLEGADSEKCAMMCLLQDLPEMRVGDHHKVSARYLSTHAAENRVFKEQLENLPKEIAEKWQRYFNEFNRRNTKEGIVAKDADWLEMALTARELVIQGHHGMQNWIDNVRKALETDSAKEILKVIEESDLNDWWQNLKKMTYKKLKKR